MTADQPVPYSGEGEIDLREVIVALLRRWRLVVGGGFLGLALASGIDFFYRGEGLFLQASLVVDVGQSPCNFSKRGSKIVQPPSEFSLFQSMCLGELGRTRYKLEKIASSFEEFNPDVGVYAFDDIGREKSSTLLNVSFVAPYSQASELSEALALIKRQMTDLVADEAKSAGLNPGFGPNWIVIENPSKLDQKKNSFRSLPIGLLGGLVVGACSGFIADRISNRVYSREELLRRLNHPMRLSLPAGSWTASAVEVLVGQLATQLDQNLSWRVLSIARQHEAVEPLTQLLQLQGGEDLQCDSADPLLSSVLRFEPCDQPTGLLLVVESGFNSARALEEARLLISQMTAVQSVGVVLIGAQLPEELNTSVTG